MSESLLFMKREGLFQLNDLLSNNTLFPNKV